MKISERKQHLRARGIVPVSQETVPGKMVVASGRGQGKAAAAAPGRKGAEPQKPPRARWQPSPRYQITFGAAYLIFSPILLYSAFARLQSHDPKVHPGLFDFAMPVVFFLFGVWWVYTGLRARRRQRMAAATTAAASGKA